MSGRLLGKTALVTGGTSGLGSEIARRFLREGARVLVTGRDERRGRAAEDELRREGECEFRRAEASSARDAERAVGRVRELWGGLDVLVNNAGVGVAAPLAETSEADWDRIMAVNVKAYFLHAKAALPHLAERRGAMVHLGSDAGVVGERGAGAYSVSKAAVLMLSQVLALDGGPLGVRSNCVCPGDTVPGMRHMLTPDGGERPEGHWQEWPVPPLGRYGQATDVASAVLFLASDESAFCNGSVLLVDGGSRAGFR